MLSSCIAVGIKALISEQRSPRMLSVVRLVCLFIGHEQNPLLPRCPWGTIALIKAGAEMLFASLGPSDPFLTLLILQVELKLPKKALA